MSPPPAWHTNLCLVLYSWLLQTQVFTLHREQLTANGNYKEYFQLAQVLKSQIKLQSEWQSGTGASSSLVFHGHFHVPRACSQFLWAPGLWPDQVTKWLIGGWKHWELFSLSVEDRDNIIHKKYCAFVSLKCLMYSSYKVREHTGPKNLNASPQGQWAENTSHGRQWDAVSSQNSTPGEPLGYETGLRQRPWIILVTLIQPIVPLCSVVCTGCKDKSELHRWSAELHRFDRKRKQLDRWSW